MKHAHGNGDQRFQRAGTDTRTAVTTAGEHGSLSTTSKIQPLPQTIQLLPARRRRSRLRRAEPLSAGHRRQSVDLATSLSYRDAANHGDSFVSMPSPTTINRRARNTACKLKQFLPDCVAGTTLTPSFLTGQSATAKTTTARPTPSKQRSAKTPPKSHAPCWICRSTLTGTKLPPNSMISAQSLTTRRSSVTLITASSQPLPTKTVTTSSISSTSAERWVTPSGTMASSPWTVGRRIVSEVIDEVFHLKNSVAKHRPAEVSRRSARGSRERKRFQNQRGNWSSSGQQRLQGIFGGGCRRL